MRSRLHGVPGSFRERFARGRLHGRDVAGIVAAGTALCALGLFALDAILVAPPVQAEARAPAPDSFTARDPGAYAGTWVSDGGAHLIVAKSGAVWADRGGLIGAAHLDPRDPTHLLFAGASFRCAYRVAADGPDALVWRLEERTPGTACPEGRYSRRFTF